VAFRGKIVSYANKRSTCSLKSEQVYSLEFSEEANSLRIFAVFGRQIKRRREAADFGLAIVAERKHGSTHLGDLKERAHKAPTKASRESPTEKNEEEHEINGECKN